MLDHPITLAPMALPPAVIPGECWARDGLQSEPLCVSTEHKVEVLAGLVEAGFRRIEATSFAHPAYLPQFNDAEEVLRRIPRVSGVTYGGICATMKAVERAIRSKDEGYGVDEIAMVISASEPHNRANVGMHHSDNMALLERMTRMALDTGHQVLGWVLTSFGCPLQGEVDVDVVLRLGRWWKELGASRIGFGDTIGAADPRRAQAFFERVRAEGFTPDEVVVHFHDTRGWGITNTLAALGCGFHLVDTSLGAIGGQPKSGARCYQDGYTGNTCTEDLIGLLDELGVHTGIDLHKMIALGRRVEEILGRQLRSNFIHAGPVRHVKRASADPGSRPQLDID